ncbi:integrase domain-containing protein [Thalassotalea aquiviva]|uniref:integrase domain-containing protein n=1 Tax=Thalassotalea aquiviva TaxID=3242415 RepID=UPI00352B7CD0
MAKETVKPITSDRQLKALQTLDKDYVRSAAPNLQIRIRKTGSKLWNFNYRHPITKRRLNMGLGSYPTISLAEARELATQARKLVQLGIDPKEEREKNKKLQIAETEHIFENVIKNWFEVKRSSVSDDYATDVWRSLENYILPQLGKLNVNDLDAPSVIEVLKPIEAKGSLETVKRLSQRLNEIMEFAANTGIIKANPISGIKSAFKKPIKSNMPTLKPHELPELLEAISEANIKKVTRYLILWQLHTMVRPSEAAGARWEEVDWENELWVIPAERMKKKREHIVPLTPEILKILEKLKPLSAHREHLFPADRNPRTHCNTQTANAAIKRMGFEGRLVSHGLRSLASTTLNEQGFAPHVIEAALAHAKENQVEAAYNRAQYLEQRKEMMNWWSNSINKFSP